MLREWRLEEVLGVGGFGIVYRGRGTYFGESVAIKEYFPSAISDRVDGETVKPSDSSSEEIYDLGLKKFLEEAKILWQLSHPERHPNIVNVRSLFEIHGTAYMVMDFESGASLSQMLRDGRRFDERSLMSLLRPIAEGLDRAHRAGVIHRDIKPPNILVDDGGRPVLIDFGSARFDAGQATSTKVTFYTPPYAALEQYVKTYQQGPWTDIYALGVVAYQCITGEKPPEVLERLHGGDGQALTSRDWPGFSQTFTRAVDAAMGIRPSERPQSITAWLALLDGQPQVADEEDVTRISVATDAPRVLEALAAATPAPAPAARAVAADASDRSEATSPRAAPQPSRQGLQLSVRELGAISIGVVILVVSSTFAAVTLFPKKATLPAVAAAPVQAASAGSGTGGAAQQPVAQPIEQAAQALATEARSANRPASEVAGLSASATRIAGLAAQLRASGSPAAPAVLDQMNGEAKTMATREAAALDRAAQPQAREIERALGRAGASSSADAARALADLRKSHAKLVAATAGVSHASDGAAALAGARDALAAYGDFANAYASAALPAKRAALAALVTQLRSTADKIVADGGKPRPGLFASQGRKQAYQTLKDNAERAKVLHAQIEELSRTIAAADAQRIATVTREAEGLKRSLAELYAVTATANQQLN